MVVMASSGDGVLVDVSKTWGRGVPWTREEQCQPIPGHGVEWGSTTTLYML